MIEKKEPDPFDLFVKDTTPDPNSFGYVPLPTNVATEPEGNVYAAHLRQENTIGSMLNRSTTFGLSEYVQEDYDFTNYANRIPQDLVAYADKFFGATSQDDFDAIESQIRAELKDKSLLSAHPWKALAYSLDPLEPTNWLPGGVIYKDAKIGSAVARSMMGASLSAVASTGIQEAILHQNQLTRSMQESIFNLVGAGVVGGVIGGGISAIASKRIAGAEAKINTEEALARQRIVDDVNNALNPQQNLSSAANTMLDDAQIAKMPKYIAQTMKLTPMNRLLTSQFKLAQWFGSSVFEHNYELVKNSDGRTSGISIERSIKQEMRQLNLLQIDHMNHYYDMHGVSGGYFKATRKKLQELGTKNPESLNLDQFNKAVYETALTGEQHALPQVNAAANMWRNEFDRLQKQAIELGLLPEDVQVPNAPNYIMVMYNKNKIIEEGGRSARGDGTFANHLFQQFQASNETLKQYLISPGYTELKSRVGELSNRIKSKPPEVLKQINQRISGIDKSIKSLENLKSKRPKEQLDKINADIKSLVESKKLAEQEVVKRQSEYVSQIKKESASHSKSATEYRKRIEKNNSKLTSLTEKLNKSSEKIGIIKGKIKAIKGETKTKSNLIEKLSGLNNDFNELKKQHTDLRNLIKEDVDHVRSNEKRIKELDQIAQHPERTLPELQKQIKEIEDKIKSLEESKKPSANEIKAHEKAIKKLEQDKKEIEKSREITKEEKELLTQEIERLEKEIIDNAPTAAKDWEGKLHNVIEGNAAQSTEDLIWNAVEQTIDHILGDSDGKLLNPFLSKIGANTKPFKSRKLIIDQLQASPWHVTDIQRIAEAHNRAMVPTIQLQRFAKQHGYKDINDMLLGMEDLMKKERDAALEGVTGKEAQKIRAQYDSNIKDMQAGIQMIQGVYGQGFNVLNSSGQQFLQNVLSWNYTRMLGHMTISSLPELGLLVMKNGFMDVLAHGIGELASTVKQISKNDLRAIGYGIETELATQFKSYIEHQGLSTNPSPFTKGLNSLTRNFGNLSIMNPFEDMVKNMAGHIAINKILRIIHRSVDGKNVSQKDLTNIARLGIARDQFDDIAKFTKDNISNGTRYADWTNWDIQTAGEANALKSFQAAVGKSIDDVSIIPHFGDKPLVFQQKGWMGNISLLTFQFKSYLLAATNRILYSGIQNRYDINTYSGIFSMMALGMLGYIASSYLRGSSEEIDLSPKNLIREGLDRSAVLGIFGEGINIGQKLFRLGEVSRYKSRDAFGSALGPTGGSASQLVDLFNKINPLSSAKGEWTTKDAEAVMRLMPLQNLFYIQKITRQITKDVAESLGATPVD